jgi:hypothetical protein
MIGLFVPRHFMSEESSNIDVIGSTNRSSQSSQFLCSQRSLAKLKNDGIQICVHSTSTNSTETFEFIRVGERTPSSVTSDGRIVTSRYQFFVEQFVVDIFQDFLAYR